MNSTNTILDRFLDPFADCLTPDVARRVVELRLDPETDARLSLLRAKANEGDLTDDERLEYEELVEAIDLIGILQAKARAVLRRQAS